MGGWLLVGLGVLLVVSGGGLVDWLGAFLGLVCLGCVGGWFLVVGGVVRAGVVSRCGCRWLGCDLRARGFPVWLLLVGGAVGLRGWWLVANGRGLFLVRGSMLAWLLDCMG